MEYGHGGDIYRNEVEYDFSVNINPLGMPEKSLEAAKKALLSCGSYPDWQAEKLCQAIAQAEGVKREQVLLGNGAAELIYAFLFALKPKNGLLLAPSFAEYETALVSAGGKPAFWKLQEEKGFALEEDFLEAIEKETDAVFVCNPNNPTGRLTKRELLIQIAQRCEKMQTYFCLDECFLPFLEQEEDLTMKGMLEQFPHMIILRAFTKIYGMPGLRLGYALTANDALRQKIRGCLQPWNTSVPAQAAGVEALKDRDYLAETRQLVKRERQFLLEELSDGLAQKVYPSGANFLLFKSRSDLKELLLQQKILIRSCSNYRNLQEGYFRIAVRTHEENRELIRRWHLAQEGGLSWQNRS